MLMSHMVNCELTNLNSNIPGLICVFRRRRAVMRRRMMKTMKTRSWPSAKRTQQAKTPQLPVAGMYTHTNQIKTSVRFNNNLEMLNAFNHDVISVSLRQY